jgi:ribosomal-protein-alanine N-acetyltransferase
MEVMRATVAHAQVMAELHAAAFPPEARWGRDAMALQLGLTGATGLVAPAGGFVLVRNVLDEAEVLTLAVHPQCRRLGIGRALMLAAIGCLEQAGVAALFLEVAEENAAAQALYAAIGFQQVGLRRGYYAGGGTALVLCADLRPCGSRRI